MSPHLSNHLFGIATEKRFDSECRKRGIVVSSPDNDQTACDRFVHIGDAILRVQIKASRTLTVYKKLGRGTKRFFCADNFRRDGSLFYENGIDVIAFFLEPLNRWHLFNASSVRSKRIKIRVTPISVRCRESIDRWQLLTAEGFLETLPICGKGQIGS